MDDEQTDARIAAADLRAFVRGVLATYGVKDAHAEVTAHRMIEADVRGVASHGIARLPGMTKRLAAGGFNLDPDIRVERETGCSALVDGDDAIGHVAVTTAVELAIRKARSGGMCWVGLRRSNHAGAAGVYTAMAAEQDLVGLYLAVASANHMPPWGGSEPMLGTNPISVAIPAGEEPDIVLDMATTVASMGKIRVTLARGEPLPEGWMVGHDGRPLTRPDSDHDGFVLPMGGYKGYGLSVVFGVLAGVLNGAAFGSEVVDFNLDHRAPTNTGQAFFAMRPDLFRDLDEFKAEMDRHIRELRAVPPLPGWDPVRLPGEAAHGRRQDVLARGVPVPPPLLATLRDLADSQNVPFPDPADHR